jgi:hypothetical protein
MKHISQLALIAASLFLTVGCSSTRTLLYDDGTVPTSARITGTPEVTLNKDGTCGLLFTNEYNVKVWAPKAKSIQYSDGLNDDFIKCNGVAQ